jgi:tetrahydromethanopterin S-methyltransferase subunit G
VSVPRDEFDRLVARVDRLERTMAATVEIIAAEVVGLRSHIDERLDGLSGRLDGLNGRLDTVDGSLHAYTEQVKLAIRTGGEAVARSERFARAIADHFGIHLGD